MTLLVRACAAGWWKLPTEALPTGQRYFRWQRPLRVGSRFPQISRRHCFWGGDCKCVVCLAACSAKAPPVAAATRESVPRTLAWQPSHATRARACTIESPYIVHPRGPRGSAPWPSRAARGAWPCGVRGARTRAGWRCTRPQSGRRVLLTDSVVFPPVSRGHMRCPKSMAETRGEPRLNT
jgi:hypothetical protein